MDSNKQPDRLTFGHLLSKFLEDLTNANKGLWGTVVQLTIRPRRVVETFLYKDRKQFTRPTKYVLITLSVFALNLAAVELRHGKSLLEYISPVMLDVEEAALNNTEEALADAIAPRVPGIDDEEEKKSFKEGFSAGFQNEMGEEVSDKSNILKYSSYINVLLIPFSAFIYWFCFPRREFNYPENLAAIAYLNSHGNIFGIIALPVILFSASPKMLSVVMATGSVISLIYTLYATINVYVKKWTDVPRAIGYFLLLFVGLSFFFASIIFIIVSLNGSLTESAGASDSPSIAQGIFRLLLSLLMLAGFLIIRFKGNRWYVGLGLSLVSLIIFFLI